MVDPLLAAANGIETAISITASGLHPCAGDPAAGRQRSLRWAEALVMTLILYHRAKIKSFHGG
ncbi:MAG: hypothetical protein AMJ54_03970 [Deltaproteobacteria bacterium SG8_13]|nr:MAG: hypothetical protein AMJ54_03970 [Deltaproteobacteria bacterium SG8_13]